MKIRFYVPAVAYEQKFYLNPRYESLPEGIKEELKILSVMLTADVGGVFTMEFEEDGFFVYVYDCQRK